MSIGKWLELKGYDVKPNTAAKPPSGPSAPPAPSPAPPAEKKEKVIKEEKDKTPTMPFEPWLDVQKPDFKPVQVGISNLAFDLSNRCISIACSSSSMSSSVSCATMA